MSICAGFWSRSAVVSTPRGSGAGSCSRSALEVERDLRRGFRVDPYEIADRVAAINDDWLE